ncbi:MAG: 2OG-Fe dioxygenase family protein [Vicinamibacterales bacterium]
MSHITSSTADGVHAAVDRAGFAFVEGAGMRAILERHGSLADWEAFAASWGRLDLDTYMADGGRYRRRRHAVYAVAAGGGITRKPHQPHYQSLDYNPMHGGIERWFQPVEESLGAGPSLTTVLECCRSTFSALAKTVEEWHVEVHQFRIEARPSEVGRPTPEGLHRDGVDYVLVLLVNRENIASGVTTIHGEQGEMLGQFTLTTPFDAAIVDDRRVAHGVTPVESIDPSKPAYRDVLVVTFKDARATAR